jgi:hydrogenase/urease accessory protein HupE
VTLILAGLELVRLSPRFTESAIALSIVVVGVENVFSHQIRWRFWTASVFGLVHGFGFAAVLADTELPRRGAVWALLAFNVGIELAQLSIVVAIFPLLALSARKRWYRRAVLVPVSAAVAAIALVWFVKRAAAVEFLPWLGS